MRLHARHKSLKATAQNPDLSGIKPLWKFLIGIAAISLFLTLGLSVFRLDDLRSPLPAETSARPARLMVVGSISQPGSKERELARPAAAAPKREHQVAALAYRVPLDVRLESELGLASTMSIIGVRAISESQPNALCENFRRPTITTPPVYSELARIEIGEMFVDVRLSSFDSPEEVSRVMRDAEHAFEKCAHETGPGYDIFRTVRPFTTRTGHTGSLLEAQLRENGNVMQTSSTFIFESANELIEIRFLGDDARDDAMANVSRILDATEAP